MKIIEKEDKKKTEKPRFSSFALMMMIIMKLLEKAYGLTAFNCSKQQPGKLEDCRRLSTRKSFKHEKWISYSNVCISRVRFYIRRSKRMQSVISRKRNGGYTAPLKLSRASITEDLPPLACKEAFKKGRVIEVFEITAKTEL